MNNSLHLPIFEDIDTDILSRSIIDIESQNDTKYESQSVIDVPLRGILKNADENIVDNKIVEKTLFKICFSLLVIVIMSPIIICDIYFGFTDTTCSSEKPHELEMSMKLYLIISGFLGLSAMIIILIGTAFFDQYKISDLGICGLFCGTIGLLCIIIFNLIWNILGAVVFWGYIYGNGHCDKSLSTYLFVSIIIKLISSLITFRSGKKYKK
jgi:hypothetical protein